MFGLLFVFHRYGDYPMLPNKSQYERDPWYQWDQPDMRHNWGEPVGTPVPLLKLLTSALLLSSNTCFLVLSVESFV